MRLEELQRGGVRGVVLVDVRVEGAGIYEQSYRGSSEARISSMRAAVSDVPLRPALAARSLRRSVRPRWVVIASLVSSDTVMPLRLAS